MTISAAGCCLIDYVYRNVQYDCQGFRKFQSRAAGDGGIIPGGLVFAEDLSAFSGMALSDILQDILGTATADTVNLGGPAIIALINTAQLLHGAGIECRFHACAGDDTAGALIRDFIAQTPVKASIATIPGSTSPATVVLADPSHDGGNGERSFINTIGAAGLIRPEDLPEEFFKADIVLLGGTALTPALHDGLTPMLRRAKASGAITVVGTVYDFRNERRSPSDPWPLGSPDACRDIDILVTDAGEARRLTQLSDLKAAARQLVSRGVGTLVITNGEQDMLAWSSGRIFRPLDLEEFPVSEDIRNGLRDNPSLFADTTGCGDNFLGGLIASLAMQLGSGRASLPLALAWGAASGGYACLYPGGLYHENAAGEKLGKIQPLAERYISRLEANGRLSESVGDNFPEKGQS